MVQCSVKGCSSRSDVHSLLKNRVHFHRIPKNPELRSKWMLALNKFEVGESTRVCSKHFKSESYYITANGVKKLIVSAIPEIELANDEISGEDENILQSSIIQTNFPRPKMIKVTHFVDAHTGNARPLNNADRTCKIETEEEEYSPKQQTPMETDPLQIKTKDKARTSLERELIKEVEKLRVLNKKRLAALKCLEEQNRRLLKRNNYLQQELDKKCQQEPEKSRAASQDLTNFLSE